jgi:hypothetical protein
MSAIGVKGPVEGGRTGARDGKGKGKLVEDCHFFQLKQFVCDFDPFTGSIDCKPFYRIFRRSAHFSAT